MAIIDEKLMEYADLMPWLFYYLQEQVILYRAILPTLECEKKKDEFYDRILKLEIISDAIFEDRIIYRYRSLDLIKKGKDNANNSRSNYK